ncbi:MAG: rhodanese [Planctomyces sp.]|nr:rhodanese [Planctomyces sp.]
MAENPIEVDYATLRLLRESGEDHVLLDCREPDEFAIAKIEGATLIPMSELQDRVHELEAMRAARIVVYCHHGARSLRVATWLRQQGFATSHSLAGGIDRWSLEVDSGVPRY